VIAADEIRQVKVTFNSLFNRVGFQRFQIHKFQHGNMARLQNYRTSMTGLECLRPAADANAPAVARCQAGEIIFGARGDEVVAL